MGIQQTIASGSLSIFPLTVSATSAICFDVRRALIRGRAMFLEYGAPCATPSRRAARPDDLAQAGCAYTPVAMLSDAASARLHRPGSQGHGDPSSRSAHVRGGAVESAAQPALPDRPLGNLQSREFTSRGTARILGDSSRPMAVSVLGQRSYLYQISLTGCTTLWVETMSVNHTFRLFCLSSQIQASEELGTLVHKQWNPITHRLLNASMGVGINPGSCTGMRRPL